MSNNHKWMLAAAVVLITAMPAMAGINDMVTQFETTSRSISSQLIASALPLLGTLWLINFFLANWRQMFSGDFPQIFTKMLASLVWAAFLLYLVRSPYDPLNMIFNGFASMAGSVGGVMDPDAIVKAGSDLVNNMFAGWWNGAENGNPPAGGGDDDWTPDFMEMGAQFGKNIGIMMTLVVVSVLVVIAFGLLALAVVMAKMEFYMVLIAAPITFALGGLDALRDTAISPLKSVLSLGYRILIIGIITALVKNMAPIWSEGFKTLAIDNWDPLFQPIFGMIIIVGMTFSAGKIAAALASGSAALSGNDALGGAMKAASMAGGAAAAAGMAGSALLGGMAKAMGVAPSPKAVGKAMGEAMNSLRSPSASNASSKVTGASSADQQRNQDIVSSMGGGGDAGGGSQFAAGGGGDGFGGGGAGEGGGASGGGSSGGGSSGGGSSGGGSSGGGSSGGGSSGGGSSGGAGQGAPASTRSASAGSSSGSSGSGGGSAMDAGIGGSGGGGSGSSQGGAGASGEQAQKAQKDAELKRERQQKARERREAMRKAMRSAADENNGNVSVSVNSNSYNN